MVVKRGRAKPEGLESKMEEPIQERLMKSALRLFTQRGYSATTVRELVQEAGVTKPALYYYFGSKEGLFLELMRTHFDRLEAEIDIYGQWNGSIRKRLMEMMDRGFNYVQQERDF